MSDQTTARPAPANTFAATDTQRTNAAIRAAQDVPSLISGLQAANSPLASQLLGKGLLASKTPWGTLAISALAWLSTRYGLGWDEQTCAIIAGVGCLAGAYLMRSVTSMPISGLFSRKPLGAFGGVAIAGTLLTLAACANAPSATTVAADAADGVTAANAIIGVATTLQQACSANAAGCVAAVESGIGTLQTTAQSLSATSSSTDISSAAAKVNSVLTTIQPYVSDVASLLPLLSLIKAGPPHDLIHLIADVPPQQLHLTDAQLKAMKANAARLKAALLHRQAQEATAKPAN